MQSVLGRGLLLLGGLLGEESPLLATNGSKIRCPFIFNLDKKFQRMEATSEAAPGKLSGLLDHNIVFLVTFIGFFTLKRLKNLDR